MDFLNMNLPPENDKNKNNPERLNSWFDFMNNQMEKIEESNQKWQINNLLIDNDIEIINNKKFK